mmetsp:Transcript_36018/g.76805  ORF Transcript_36018/g.76805 Transcript_36018/m.76805 type:complete len:233 (-) Transcript_36018:65-763(-)
MIQDTRRIDDLPPHVIVVQVTNKQRLSGEGVRLHIDVCGGDDVHEGGLTDIGVAGQNHGSRRRVDGGQTAEMLANLFEVGQRARQLLHGSRHATQGGPLEHLALVETVGELHHLHVVLRDHVNDFLRRVHLTEGQLVVIAIVQDVAEISVEGMDVVDLREVLQDLAELFAIRSLTELNLPHVEVSNSGNLEARVDHSRGLAVGLGQTYVHELLRRGDGLDLFELVHDESWKS